MREADKREIYGIRFHSNPIWVSREIIQASHIAAIAEHKGKPAAVIGACELWPSTWSLFSLGTDDWSKCVISLTRYALRTLKPHFLTHGATRVQCESHSSHIEAHRWLAALGGKPQTLHRFGRDGSDYLQFTWVIDDVLLSSKTSRTATGPATA